MKTDYVHIKIDQTDKNEFDIQLKGEGNAMLKVLAKVVAETVLSAPKEYQQQCRTQFLQYLNQATIEEHRKEI